MTPRRSVRMSFCTKCNAERPLLRAKVRDDKGRLRVGRVCAFCRERVLLPSKYNNVPTRSKLSGEMFQSKREAAREPVLLALLNVGKISDYRRQQPFSLEVYSTQAVDALLEVLDSIKPPAGWCHWAADNIEQVRRSRQRIAKYVADFVYTDDLGNTVVEDPKGAKTAVYRMKKRLMVACHNIEIQEPGPGGVTQWARGAGVAGRGTGSRLRGARAR